MHDINNIFINTKDYSIPADKVLSKLSAAPVIIRCYRKPAWENRKLFFDRISDVVRPINSPFNTPMFTAHRNDSVRSRSADSVITTENCVTSDASEYRIF